MPYDICEDETTLSFIENEMAKRGVTQDLIDTTRAETETRMLHDLAGLVADKGDLEFRWTITKLRQLIDWWIYKTFKKSHKLIMLCIVYI